MAEAAVIDRVRAAADGFKDAAPGHVFQLYLPMWGAGWSLDKNAKGEAARRSTAIPAQVCQLAAALRERQAAQAGTAGAFTRRAESTSPFATGLGNEHPIENGFAFLTPYGLPYLAGSGIKGVLRRAMQELGNEGDSRFDRANVEALLGVEKVVQPEDAWRGALDVWDCFPQPKDGKLVVEIMTPHHGGYYMKNDTPHDAGQPIPVPFLAVPAGSQFDFHVVCHEGRLPEPLRGGRWQALLDAAFDHAFDWLGFGAKTAVGYGAMAIDTVRERKAAEARDDNQRMLAERAKKVQREVEKTRMLPADRAMADLFDQRLDKNQDERAVLFTALKAGKLGEHRMAVAQRLQALMQAQGRWRETTQKKNPDKDQPYQDTLLVKKWITP